MTSTRIFAKQLRKTMTAAEQLLWRELRARRFQAHKFRRQQPIGPYIVDFVDLSAKLVIEADGSQHLESEQDQFRDAWLISQGFKVLRFWNHNILQRTEEVLEAIWQAGLEARAEHPSPQPLSHKGRGANNSADSAVALDRCENVEKKIASLAVPLAVDENYARSRPSLTNPLDPSENSVKHIANFTVPLAPCGRGARGEG